MRVLISSIDPITRYTFFPLKVKAERVKIKNKMTDNTEGLCTVKYEKLKSANSEVRNSKICIITESTAAMNKDIYEKTNVNI